MININKITNIEVCEEDHTVCVHVATNWPNDKSENIRLDTRRIKNILVSKLEYLHDHLKNIEVSYVCNLDTNHSEHLSGTWKFSLPKLGCSYWKKNAKKFQKPLHAFVTSLYDGEEKKTSTYKELLIEEKINLDQIATFMNKNSSLLVPPRKFYKSSASCLLTHLDKINKEEQLKKEKILQAKKNEKKVASTAPEKKDFVLPKQAPAKRASSRKRRPNKKL